MDFYFSPIGIYLFMSLTAFMFMASCLNSIADDVKEIKHILKKKE